VAQIEEAGREKSVEEGKKPPERPEKVQEVEKVSGAEAPAFTQPEREKAEPSRPVKAEKPVVAMAEESPAGAVISQSARALARSRGVDLSAVTPTGPGGRITEGDVLLYLERSVPTSRDSRPQQAPKPAVADFVRDESVLTPAGAALPGEETVRKTMSPIRQRIAARLMDAVRNTAMLTTFNEIDMSRVQALRKQFGEQFRQKHGVRLGLMSFFVKASVCALKEMPEVNAFMEGKEILYHNYCNIGVAIGAERGLIVPVIRNAENLGFAAIERAIIDFSKKVEENRLGISTITNGGVFGSLMSTPILNPPQSAILGMHKVEDRPVAAGENIVIRPMMYVALTYDHRIIDGRQAVTFLRRIKEMVENPERIMMEI
jgi:2-oxoglutarate dehydrogenase E2 component (dihydrolipoamide succinyltransferase)